MRAISLALGACTAASLYSSSLVDFSQTPSSALTPRRGAFSIWGLIYTLLIACTVVVASLRGEVKLLPHVLVCVSLAITCAWSLTVSRSRGLAVLALISSALAAWTSLPFVKDNHLFSAAYGLLAGWLSVAVTISTELNDRRVLVVASSAIGAASVSLSTPWPVISLIWGLVGQLQIDRVVAGSAFIAVACGATAVARLYVG